MPSATQPYLQLCVSNEKACSRKAGIEPVISSLTGWRFNRLSYFLSLYGRDRDCKPLPLRSRSSLSLYGRDLQASPFTVEICKPLPLRSRFASQASPFTVEICKPLPLRSRFASLSLYGRAFGKRLSLSFC